MDEPFPGRRSGDPTRGVPYFVCTDCGEAWIPEFARERFEQGAGCPSCGGRLELLDAVDEGTAP